MEENKKEEEEDLIKKAKEIFFEDIEFEPKELYEIVKKCANFCTMNPKTGEVLLKRIDLTGKDRVALVAIARFLGNQLDSNVSPTVTVEEVSKYAMLDKDTTTARLSELTKEGLLVREGGGVYKVRSFATLRKFIQDVEAKFMEESDKRDNRDE